MVYCRIIAIDKTETQSWGEVTDPQRNRHQVTSDPPVCRSHRSKKNDGERLKSGGRLGGQVLQLPDGETAPPAVIGATGGGGRLSCSSRATTALSRTTNKIWCQTKFICENRNPRDLIEVGRSVGRNMALLLLLLPVFASGLKLTPPENIWVRGVNINLFMITIWSSWLALKSTFSS